MKKILFLSLVLALVSVSIEAQTILIAEDAAKTVLVPTDGSLGSTWTGGNEPFDDNAWTPGTGSVGYASDQTFGYDAGIDVEGELPGLTSVYIRTAFTSSGDARNMALRVKSDDGFIAYLNGAEVARSRSANGVTTPDWDSLSGNHNDGPAIAFESFNISAFTSALVAGTNILAVHGMQNSTGSSDFLISFQLTANEDATLVVPESGAKTAQVQLDGSLGMTWTAVGFDDSGWIAGSGGVGYASDTTAGYATGLDVEGPMSGNAFGVYIRSAVFNLTETVDVVRLRARIDDGMVAYLNGVRFAVSGEAGQGLGGSANPTVAPAAAVWDTDTSSAGDEDAPFFQEFYAPGSAVVLGDNMLAVHGMNTSLTSSDLIISYELWVGKTFVFLKLPVGGLKTVGSSHTFEAELVNAVGAVTYQWTKDGSPVGPDSGTFTIDPLALTDSGDYACAITDTSGTYTTPAVTLTVLESTVVPAAGPFALLLGIVALLLSGAALVYRRAKWMGVKH